MTTTAITAETTTDQIRARTLASRAQHAEAAYIKANNIAEGMREIITRMRALMADACDDELVAAHDALTTAQRHLDSEAERRYAIHVHGDGGAINAGQC